MYSPSLHLTGFLIPCWADDRPTDSPTTKGLLLHCCASLIIAPPAAFIDRPAALPPRETRHCFIRRQSDSRSRINEVYGDSKKAHLIHRPIPSTVAAVGTGDSQSKSQPVVRQSVKPQGEQ